MTLITIGTETVTALLSLRELFSRPSEISLIESDNSLLRCMIGSLIALQADMPFRDEQMETRCNGPISFLATNPTGKEVELA